MEILFDKYCLTNKQMKYSLLICHIGAHLTNGSIACILKLRQIFAANDKFSLTNVKYSPALRFDDLLLSNLKIRQLDYRILRIDVES